MLADEHLAVPLTDRFTNAMLSKSRFLTGLQCHRLLWWTVHDRDAPEVAPDARLQAILDQGTLVGELARERFPGGILIPHDERRVEATCEAIAAGATVLYEASFVADEVFAAVDILLREDNGSRMKYCGLGCGSTDQECIASASCDV